MTFITKRMEFNLKLVGKPEWSMILEKYLRVLTIFSSGYSAGLLEEMNFAGDLLSDRNTGESLA